MVLKAEIAALCAQLKHKFHYAIQVAGLVRDLICDLVADLLARASSLLAS